MLVLHRTPRHQLAVAAGLGLEIGHRVGGGDHPFVHIVVAEDDRGPGHRPLAAKVEPHPAPG